MTWRPMAGVQGGCANEAAEERRWSRNVIEHLDRADFLHEPARKWQEVGWVAKRAWLTRAEVRKGFGDEGEQRLMEL